MATVKHRGRTKEIRDFVLEHVEKGGENVARTVAQQFGITRQAVSKHLRALIDDGVLTEEGVRRKRYTLAVTTVLAEVVALRGLEEDVAFRTHIKPLLANDSEFVNAILFHGVTEMINNAVDHSDGHVLLIDMRRTARMVEVTLTDDGVGIFQKIQKALNLEHERESVLELAKGKFTTAPGHHSGEGIFFTSRMCDEFALMAGTTYFTSERGEDCALETSRPSKGTTVWMKVNLDTKTRTADVFEKYANVDGGFSKTNVPVSLAKYGADGLVSRSQAKRVMARVEKFQEVLLDFAGIDEVGQAFADEIFRVFAKNHPSTKLFAINTTPRVQLFINRARLGAGEDRGAPESTEPAASEAAASEPSEPSANTPTE